MPNMTAVNVRKRMASRHRKINSRTDTPGEKSLHSGKERDALVSAVNSFLVNPYSSIVATKNKKTCDSEIKSSLCDLLL